MGCVLYVAQTGKEGDRRRNKNYMENLEEKNFEGCSGLLDCCINAALKPCIAV
jgi:hypothetical protein